MPHSLCHIDDIEDPGARGFEIDEHNLFVVKRDAQVYVYLNSCPHIGIPLEFLPDEFLDDGKQYILCANHGALFNVDDGLCITGPCHGQALIAVDYTLNDGVIVVSDIPAGY